MSACTQVRSPKAEAGRSWLDAWLETIPQERIRSIATPDGVTHLSVQCRPGAPAEALRDAATLYHRRQTHSHRQADDKRSQGADSQLEAAGVGVPTLAEAPSLSMSSYKDLEGDDGKPAL